MDISHNVIINLDFHSKHTAMNFSPKILFYQVFIDPILSRLHGEILSNIRSSDRIIDIACGTGSLALAIAGKAKHVTGIDIDEDGIIAARRSARSKGAGNVLFEVRDASDLSCYSDREFDIAVTSMAIHQFDAELAVKILSEMKRIAPVVVIADYNHHIPRGWGRSVVRGIERLAGGEHHRNFTIYMQLGGLHYFMRKAGLRVRSESIRGKGVFLIAMCES